MKAFNNDAALKATILNTVWAVDFGLKPYSFETPGYRRQNTPGRAIVDAARHAGADDPLKLGIPVELLDLADTIFLGLVRCQDIWPTTFINEIRVGANLSKAWPEFCRGYTHEHT